MKYTLIKTFLAAIAIFFAVNANAATSQTGETTSTFPKTSPVDRSGMRPHVAVTAGVASPEGSYNAAPELGLDIGYQPYIPFGVGAMVTTSRNTSNKGGRDLERTAILARGSYNFGGTTPIIEHSWVGVAAGPVFKSNGTDLGIAPMVGFDIPLRNADATTTTYVSLGADAKWLALINSDEADTFTVNGVLKYWF